MDGRCLVVDGGVELGVLMDDIGYCLSVGRGPGSTAVYSVVNMSELIGDSVGLCVRSDGIAWKSKLGGGGIAVSRYFRLIACRECIAIEVG